MIEIFRIGVNFIRDVWWIDSSSNLHFYTSCLPTRFVVERKEGKRNIASGWGKMLRKSVRMIGWKQISVSDAFYRKIYIQDFRRKIARITNYFSWFTIVFERKNSFSLPPLSHKFTNNSRLFDNNVFTEYVTIDRSSLFHK